MNREASQTRGSFARKDAGDSRGSRRSFGDKETSPQDDKETE